MFWSMLGIAMAIMLGMFIAAVMMEKAIKHYIG